MTLIVDGTTGVTFNDSSLQGAAASPYVLKNRIINGDMRIDQRNAGASVTPTAGVYTLDRYAAILSQASKFSVQQNAAAVTPPTGFTNYLGVTSLSSYAVLTGDYFQIVQAIEGYNISDLAWGTANAKTVTLSFWVRSSLTGTFAGAFNNAANNRSYVFNYTISSANTWEQKTITVAGDTTGTWGTTTGIGINLRFSLGGGATYQTTAGAWTAGDYFTSSSATSVVGTNGATFYITGVQLEQNTSATPFERRLYGQELANCYRYYQQLNFGGAIGANGMGLVTTKYAAGDSAIANAQLLAPMRATPTVTKQVSTARFVNSGGIANLSAVTAGTFGLNGPLFVTGVNNSIPAGSNGWIDEIYSIYITAEL
jgi:hypothetical protein